MTHTLDPPQATGSSAGARARANAMSDRARFWFWIAWLVVTCLVLGAVLASAALQGVLAELPVGDQASPHRPPPVEIVVE